MPEVAEVTPSVTPATTPAVTSSTTSVSTTPTVETPTTPSFTYKEDRSAWVDPQKYRLAEKATELAARRAERLDAELAAERRRVQALAGVTPRDEGAVEVENTLAALYKMAPHLSPEQINEEINRRIQSSPEVQGARRAEMQQWDTYRDQQFDRMGQKVASALSVSELSPKQRSAVVAAFRASLPNPEPDANGEPTNPEWFALKKRHEARDPKLFDEFVDGYIADMIEPARRSGMVRQRVAVPSGGSSHPVVRTEPKPKPGNIDAAMDRYVKILREGAPS